MLSTPSLRKRLAADHPSFTFADGADYHWSPSEATIYVATHTDDPAALLHELAHALLGHTDYSRDIALLAMERDAWTYASDTLAPRYNVSIDESTVQDALDTYRDWLHARSGCPECKATGMQTQQHHYKCIACGTLWRVNDARACALRRYREV